MEAVGKSIRGPQRMLVSHGSLTYDLPYQDLFFLQIEYLVKSACKSDFLVFVSYDSQFVFVLHPCCQSIQFSASKKASYQGVMVIMIIEIPFVLICVSFALLYLLYSYT